MDKFLKIGKAKLIEFFLNIIFNRLYIMICHFFYLLDPDTSIFVKVLVDRPQLIKKLVIEMGKLR